MGHTDWLSEHTTRTKTGQCCLLFRCRFQHRPRQQLGFTSWYTLFHLSTTLRQGQPQNIHGRCELFPQISWIPCTNTLRTDTNHAMYHCFPALTGQITRKHWRMNILYAYQKIVCLEEEDHNDAPSSDITYILHAYCMQIPHCMWNCHLGIREDI